MDFTVRSFMLPIIDHLRAQGMDVRVGCAPGKYTPELLGRGLTMAALPMARSRNPFKQLRAFGRIYRYLRRERIQILHAHTPIAALIGRAAAFLARTPLVFYTAHGFYCHDEMPASRRRLHILLEKFGACMSDFVFTCSDEDRCAAIALGICKPDAVKTILNGIDLKRFDPDRFPPEERTRARKQLGIPADAAVVSISGRLVREKGYFEFFEAAAQILKAIPRARFLILGDVLDDEHDNAKAAMIARARELGVLEATVFAGMRDDMPQMLLASDLFTLPSYREGMPYSILEAMAMRLPVVATNIRGCREEVVDGETGYLVPTRDAAALAAKITRLLTNAPQARAMGEAGRRRVEQNFEQSMTVARQWEEYERLIQAKGFAR
ncbi:MAG: glycosyltransferase family 4 protein [Candidatus Sumerlaeota bacterium]|nr:glycosyltransferase family 4 protein [Candidatus Sumerlaeota bacterium]